MTYRPKRIAAPSVIASAASILHAQIERSQSITDAERDAWHSASAKAYAQLMNGIILNAKQTRLCSPRALAQASRTARMVHAPARQEARKKYPVGTVPPSE